MRHQKRQMSKINIYRNRIEALSHDIVALVERRAIASHQIAEFKKTAGMPIIDEDREQELLARLKARTKLPEELVEDLFEVIIKHSRNIQSR